MIGTPIRWLIMLLVAACGFFIITGKDSTTRMLAFLGTVVLYQAYGVVLMWEADLVRNAGIRKKQVECSCDCHKAVGPRPQNPPAAGTVASADPPLKIS